MNRVLFIQLFLIFNLVGAQSIKSDEDISSIKLYYETIENTNHLSDLESKLLWKRTIQVVDLDDSYNITLESVKENRWTQIEIQHLKLARNSKGNIIATGILSGRQPSECDYIQTPFEHIWVLKNNISNQTTKN